jgi:hypothetical protein
MARYSPHWRWHAPNRQFSVHLMTSFRHHVEVLRTIDAGEGGDGAGLVACQSRNSHRLAISAGSVWLLLRQVDFARSGLFIERGRHFS